MRVLTWFLFNGALSYINQYSGLSVLEAMSSPLSHALANVMKRATVITAAMVYAARPVTPLHVCGVALSVFGALGYQHILVWDSYARGEIHTELEGGVAVQYVRVPLQDEERNGATCDEDGGTRSTRSGKV